MKSNTIDIDLKMSIGVKLLSNSKVRFSLLHIPIEVFDFFNPTFYKDKNGYELIKNAFNFQYYKDKFIMPSYIYNNNYICEFKFIDDDDRYTSLKKLSKTLIGFSKSNIFKDRSYVFNFYKNKIVYSDEYWFIY